MTEGVPLLSDECSRGWRKSSYCPDDECVEIRVSGSLVQIRNSGDRPETIVSVTRAEWTAFLAGVRNGEFDVVNGPD